MIVTLRPTGTVFSGFDSTPVTAEALHHTLIDEVTPNETDFISTFNGVCEAEFNLENVPVGADRILSFKPKLHIRSFVSGVDSLTLTLVIRLGGVTIVSTSFDGNTDDLWENIPDSLVLPSNVLVSDWNAGVKTIYLKLEYFIE